MNMLVLGGTRFTGKHLVNDLLKKNHRVTIATRGIAKDDFGNRVERIVTDRCSAERLRESEEGNREHGDYYKTPSHPQVSKEGCRRFV